MNLDKNKVETNKKFLHHLLMKLLENLKVCLEIKSLCFFFGTESAVILHIISAVDKNFPLPSEHKFLFDQTLDYKNKLINLFKFENFLEVFPNNSDLEKFDPNNNLWKKDLRNVVTLEKSLDKVLKNYDAWISGRKSYQGGERRS